MDFFKNIPDTIIQFFWLFVVAISGAVVGFLTKTNKLLIGKSILNKLRALIVGIISSMFIAYLTHELLITVIDSNRLVIALSGLAAYIGTDLLIALQEALINKLKSKITNL